MEKLNNKAENKAGKKKVFWIIVLAAALAAIAICTAVLIKMYTPANDDMSEYKNPTEPTTEATPESTQQLTEPELPENPIDFKALQNTNPDIYAWITVPNTLVDYPILQADANTSDSFYLEHDMNKEYEFAGSIYSEKVNKKDFSDPVTLLYGHNMKNDSMFGSLHKFENSEFFKENDTFYVYMPGHILTYQVAAAYVYDNRHIINTFNFSEKSDIEEYFDSIMNPKSMTENVRDGLKLTVNDKVLTLSTCNNNKAQRYLVQGVLINDERTK